MISEEQFDKLPRYVQDEIERLRRDRESLRAKLAQIDSGESAITWDEFDVHGDGRHAIPPGANVRFQLPSGEIAATLRDDCVMIQADKCGGVVLVQPMSSNVVRLRVGGYWREG